MIERSALRRCTENLTVDWLVLLQNILDQTARVINHLLGPGAALRAPSLVDALRKHSQLMRLEEELVGAISDFAPVCLQRLEENGTGEMVRVCVPALTQLWNLARSARRCPFFGRIRIQQQRGRMAELAAGVHA